MGGKRWTNEEKAILLNHHKDETRDWLAEQTGRSLPSVNSMLSYLGLIKSNHWSKAEEDTLREVWGSMRRTIERALPGKKWRYIRKKAIDIGLSSLEAERLSIRLGTILQAMNYNSSTPAKWKSLGLQIKVDKGKGSKLPSYYVDIDKFWEFVLENPGALDIHRLPADLLGAEPKEIRDLRKTCPKRKPRVRLTAGQRENIIWEYLNTSVHIDTLAERYGITSDTIRHIMCNYRKDGGSTKKKTYRTVRNETFLKKLEDLYYVQNKTQSECVTLLNCSMNSVQRGIKDIYEDMKTRKKVANDSSCNRG